MGSCCDQESRRKSLNFQSKKHGINICTTKVDEKRKTSTHTVNEMPATFSSKNIVSVETTELHASLYVNSRTGCEGETRPVGNEIFKAVHPDANMVSLLKELPSSLIVYDVECNA